MRPLWILLAFVFSIGCNTPDPSLNPNLIHELRGIIRPVKSKSSSKTNGEIKAYKIGENIEVGYWLENVSSSSFEEIVVDGSKDDNVAFRYYNFNAVQMNSRSKRYLLQGKTIGKPFVGKLSLEPGKKLLFTKNIFSAKKPGVYVLTFQLNWRNKKKIRFLSVPIKVESDNKQEIKDPRLQELIELLISKDKDEVKLAREELEEYGPSVIPVLIQSLGNKNEFVRRSVVDILLKMILKDKTVDLQDIMLIILDELGTPTKANREIRIRSINILAKLRKETSAKNARDIVRLTLKSLRNDPDQLVRQIALNIVEEYTKKDPVDYWLPALLFSLKDGNIKIRQKAFRVLKKSVGIDQLKFNPKSTDIDRTREIKKLKKLLRKKYPKIIK